MLHRRLAHGYETKPMRSESMIRLAAISAFAKHVAGEAFPTW